jgi:AcrR family transcriptional regulator
MPRNRRDVDRVDKEREIVAVAADLALAEGPDSVTVSSVARRLDLARNAISWYFPTRDHLLASTFRYLAAEAVSNPPPRLQLNGRLEWATGRLAELRPLYLHLGARAQESEIAADVVAETQDRLYQLLADSLRGRVAPEEVDAAAMLLGVFVEGLLARPRPADERATLIRLATARLAPATRGRTGVGAPARRSVRAR